MREPDILSRTVVAVLPVAFFLNIAINEPVVAEELVAPQESSAMTILQPDTGPDRIISWYGYELKVLEQNRLGVFVEGGGLVGERTCGCSGVGSCRLIVAEVPHYSFCVRSEDNACSGACAFE